MRTFWKWALVLGLPAVCLATARPADPPQRSRGERVVAMEEVLELLLLRQHSVREELKIGHDDAEKIFEFTAKQQEEAEKVNDLPEAERRAKYDRMARENTTFLATHLTPQQHTRLEQISMHLAGLMWLTRPAIAGKLKLTAEQKEKAHQYQDQARKDVAEALRTEDRDARRQKLAELHKANHDRLLELLTDEQKATWKELAGPPFKGKIVFEEPEEGGGQKQPEK
jgi:hypothetical protein